MPCGPEGDAFGPDIEGDVVVAAGVEDLGAVEAEVEEIGGDVEEAGPLDGIGADEGDFVAAQETDELGADEGLVADFDSVTEGAGYGSLEADAALSRDRVRRRDERPPECRGAEG